MRRLLLGACAFAGVVAATPLTSVLAATLHPSVEAEIHAGSFDETMSVLVYLQEAPVPQMNADLSSQGATRPERYRAIVEALQNQQRTQDPVKAWLDAEIPSGRVLGYTSYWIMNCLVVEATKEAILEIAGRAEIERIEPNWQPELIEPVQAPQVPTDELGVNGFVVSRGVTVTPGVVAIKADQVWNDFGITGAGRLIGGLDTGVDGNHAALASRWRGVTEPASECWLDVLGTNTTFPNDGNGHGTHTMGTMTGRNASTGDIVGVAWGAKWIAGNAINQGVGGGFDNDVITSFQWFMNPDGNVSTMDDVPDVVQNSWRINEGFGGGYTDCDTRWWTAIDNCEAAGVVVVFSAGNEGPGAGTIGSPPDRATTEYNAFSIGAADATNFNAPYPIASFSSRGPSGCPVSAQLKIKPEVTGPGVDVYSTLPGGGYGFLSGTSMSGPHVSGIVPLLREADPNLSVDEIKQILIETAIDYGTAGNDNTYGYGFVDALAAVESALVGFGRLEGFVGNASFGNAPIAGATVTVVEEDRTFSTQADGTYSGLVPPGTFTVVASHPSFAPQQFQVVVGSETTVQNFSLTDIAGPTITNLSNPLTTSDTVGPYAMSASITDASSVSQARLYYRVNNGGWQFVNMIGSGTYTGSIPGQDAGARVDFYVWAQDGVGLTATYPANAPITYHSLYVTEVAYAYDVESADANWLLSAPGDNATTGLWVRVDPVGTDNSGPIQPEDDHTPAPGVTCFITGNTPVGGGAGDNDVDNGCTTLRSPIFDLSEAELAFVSYARWFMMGGASTDDVFRIEVSNNGGGTWQALETVSAYSPNWAEATVELSDLLTLTNQMQFRFIACDINTQGLTECGIDDFALEVFVPNNPAALDDLVDATGSVLQTNAPNPMDSFTTLRFRLSNASDAHLAIYDASGRLVRTLVNGPLSSGSHQIGWDGRDARGHEVEAGVYFYRLEAGAFSQSRRLLVVR